MLNRGQVFMLSGFAVLVAMVYPVVVDPMISTEKWRKFREDNKVAEYEFYDKDEAEKGAPAPASASNRDSAPGSK